MEKLQDSPIKGNLAFIRLAKMILQERSERVNTNSALAVYGVIANEILFNSGGDYKATAMVSVPYIMDTLSYTKKIVRASISMLLSLGLLSADKSTAVVGKGTTYGLMNVPKTSALELDRKHQANEIKRLSDELDSYKKRLADLEAEMRLIRRKILES